MQTPEQELTESLASACLRARDRGMRYAAILDTIRTIEARVRVAQRARVVDIDLREQAQPRLSQQQRQSLPAGREGVLRTGYKPMANIVAQVLQQSPGQKPGGRRIA